LSKNYIEKANQVTTTDTATIVGERLVPEDESVEVVVVGVVTVVLPPDDEGVPDEGVPDGAAGAAADALPTVTATFMPLPQWPTMPQMK
jgi:hypothetical protein